MLSRCRLPFQLHPRLSFSTCAVNFDLPITPRASPTDGLINISPQALPEVKEFKRLRSTHAERKHWKRVVDLEQRRARVVSSIQQVEFQLSQFDQKSRQAGTCRIEITAGNLIELLDISQRQIGRLEHLCQPFTRSEDRHKLLDRWSRDDKIISDKIHQLNQPPRGQGTSSHSDRLNARRLRLQSTLGDLSLRVRAEYLGLAGVIPSNSRRLLQLGKLQQSDINTAYLKQKAADNTILSMKHSLGGDEKGSVKRRKVERRPAPTLAECGNTDVLDIEAKDLLSRPRAGIPETETQCPPNGAATPDKTNPAKYLNYLMGEDKDNEAAGISKNGNKTASHGQTVGQRKQPQVWREFELDIEEFSSIGEGLVRHPSEPHVYVVPFALPGDKIKIKAREPAGNASWSKADFLEILNPSKLREGIDPQCKYFSQCGGCQLQMISYEDQLKFKKSIVEKAYKNFSGLNSSQIPEIGPTGGSPLQYGYRTKLTPHFDGPPKGSRYTASTVPPIGFTRKNFSKVMDIENCPIGTPILQKGLRTERSKIIAKIGEYKRGATVLLRETTDRTYDRQTLDKDGDGSRSPVNCSSPLPPNALEVPELQLQPGSNNKKGDLGKGGTPGLKNTYIYNPNPDSPSSSESATTVHETKHYTTNNESLATEHIGSYVFKTRAGSFFQNNNSILPSFLSYVRSRILLPTTPSTTTTTTTAQPKPQQIKYLLDAYCGSGLFAITLSPLFTSVLGIELDPWGVRSARSNAEINNVTNAGFIEADAAALFEDVPYPPENTALVIDPPRKGCSTDFLRQLLAYAPMRVVYVSCNVGTQARDVGVLVRGWCGDDWWKEGGEEEEKEEKEEKKVRGRYRYEVEEVRGYDFFPQTGHVEGLAVLRRVENEAWKAGEGGTEQVDSATAV